MKWYKVVCLFGAEGPYLSAQVLQASIIPTTVPNHPFPPSTEITLPYLLHHSPCWDWKKKKKKNPYNRKWREQSRGRALHRPGPGVRLRRDRACKCPGAERPRWTGRRLRARSATRFCTRSLPGSKRGFEKDPGIKVTLLEFKGRRSVLHRVPEVFSAGKPCCQVCGAWVGVGGLKAGGTRGVGSICPLLKKSLKSGTSP